MIWLTWRQFRIQALVAASALVVVAAVLAATAPHLSRLYDSAGVSACGPTGGCAAADDYLAELNVAGGGDAVYMAGIAAVYFLPGLIGIFWGAPLISRELETGTFRLAWNQSVTRNRWLSVKLGLVGLSAMAAAGLLSLLVTWWAAPIERAARRASTSKVLIDRFGPVLFGARGVAPIGYAAFAFALGVAVGVVARRAIPAMALTLAVFVGVQGTVALAVRPHLMSPASTTVALDSPSIAGFFINGARLTVNGNTRLPGALVVSTRTLDAAGKPFDGTVPQICRDPGSSPDACRSAVAALRLQQVVDYQPADRYWTFQWLETGIYAGLTLLMTGACWVSVKRSAGR
jgi:hypothetical protein